MNFFFPLTELEFWLMAGMIESAPSYFYHSKRTLLLTDHPRIQGKFNDIIPSFFSEVYTLPYCTYSYSYIKTFKQIRHFKHAISLLPLSKESLLIGCGWRDIMHLIMGDYIKKLPQAQKPAILSLNMMIDLIDENTAVDIKRTLLANLYTIPLIKKTVTAHRIKKIKSFLFAYTCPKVYDILINIEHSTATPKDTKIYHNAPFPCTAIAPLKRRKYIHEQKAILIFVDNALSEDYRLCDKNYYWERINKLLITLHNAYPDHALYVKLHPASTCTASEKISPEIPIKEINKNISSEELYICHRNQISAVFSSVSTSLLTASWFGIPAFDCSALLGINKIYLAQFKKYFLHRKRIIPINSLHDLPPPSYITSYSHPQKFPYEEWETVLANITHYD